jgi:ech hydrogenase subunit F
MFKMTHNILRNLVVKKSTRRYPFEVRETFDKVRGELVNDIARCIFCGTCEVKCPSQCIEVDRKAAVWTCDPFACVYCGVCVDTCPAKSLFQKTQYRRPEDQRVMISMQGELKKKSKTKDKSQEKEAQEDPGAEEATPGGEPPAS